MFAIFKKKQKICAPISGKLIALSDVHDPVFSSEMMGKGWAILPDCNQVVSPINGTVVMIADSKHAIGLKTKDGAEILIHIGLDTVNLGGKYFEVDVKAGDTVKIGDKLIRADFQKIISKGFDTTTMILLTNSVIPYRYSEKIGRNIDYGEDLLDY